jgi:hypothetical protein
VVLRKRRLCTTALRSTGIGVAQSHLGFKLIHCAVPFLKPTCTNCSYINISHCLSIALLTKPPLSDGLRRALKAAQSVYRSRATISQFVRLYFCTHVQTSPHVLLFRQSFRFTVSISTLHSSLVVPFSGALACDVKNTIIIIAYVQRWASHCL